MEGLENFNNVENQIKKLVLNFSFDGELTETSINKIGNINDTYVLEFRGVNNEKNKYILQRVNCDVFKNPVNLMENICRVTEHIKAKIEEASGDVNRGTLNLISTIDGDTHFFCENGYCWRAFKFIEGARTYMVATEPKHMYETGKALGKFQKYLTDFKADTLHETIPDFHNTAKRFETFEM
ncbi:MAG: mucin desulfatase, partial [Clostridium sp.]